MFRLLGPPPERWVYALLLGWLVACAAWSQLVAPAGYLLSFDDVWRLVHAHETSHGALAPSDVWPPLQFWIFGAGLRIFPDATIVPRAIDLLASVGTLLVLDRLALATGLSRPGRVAAVCTLGALPAFAWIAPSALVEPLALFSGSLALLGAFRWWVEDRRDGLVLASVALSLAGMLRYEAWAWLAVLAAACALRREPRWLPLLAMGLVFPIGWCVRQALVEGDPLHFATFAQAFLTEDEVDPSLAARASAAWGGVWEAVGPIGLAGALGIASARVRGRALVFGVPLGLAALQLVAHVFGFAGLHNLWRHYLVLAPSLTLGVGVLVERVRLRAGRVAGWGLLALVLQPIVKGWEWPPSGYADELGVVAERVRALHHQLGGTVMIEGVGYDSRVLQILLGDMDAAVFDRLIWLVPLDRPMTVEEKRSNASRLDRPLAEVERWLDTEHVRVLAVRTPDALQKARTAGHLVASVPDGPESVAPEGDGWYVFRR